MKIKENFGKNFGEISEIPKIREKFPGKFLRKIPGKLKVFFTLNTMIQS